jgi:outer membrane lipoprotein SlyB
MSNYDDDDFLPGDIRWSRLAKQKELRDRMTATTNTLASMSSSAPDYSYTKGILGGAASGAALGTEVNAGWGTLIGGVAGAATGAIGTAVHKKNERENTPDDSDVKEGLKLQNKLLQQQWSLNQTGIDRMTKLRNSFKYR